MLVKKWYVILLILLVSCTISGNVVFDDEMGESSGQSSNVLHIDPESVKTQQAEFVAKLRNSTKNKRPLFEEYIDVIGANGILDGIENVWPKCHDEAHDLGKVIYSKVKNIGLGLRVCADRCYSGCMHGVLMEAFSSIKSDDSEGHIEPSILKSSMNDICYSNKEMTSSYSPGDCAHGVGHALMYLTNYNIPEAIDSCKLFEDSHMAYYCATGAYMEYVIENDEEDAKTKPFMYPCDSFDYPAACARYKLVYVAFRHYNAEKKPEELLQECKKFEGKYRIGCYHGLGNAHMSYFVTDKFKIGDICLLVDGDERWACIDGAMERMSKYYKPKALAVCNDLKDKDKQDCLDAVERGMYNMEKDLSMYLSE